MCPQTFIVNQTLIIVHEHYALFMWNHQRWIIGRTHRKRERDIARWGEGEREKRLRERVRRWFLSKTVIFGFDHRPKSTRDILRYRYWPCVHKVISRCLQTLKSLVLRYFYFPTVSGAHDFCSNNSDVFHSCFKQNSVEYWIAIANLSPYC